MSRAAPSRPSTLASLGKAALWAGAAVVLGRTQTPSRPPPRRLDPAEEAAEKRREMLTYAIGYGLALALTCLAFALVYWRWAEPPVALGIVFGLGLIQVLVHFRCFLHIDFKDQARDDLLLILFSTLIVSLMVGGTLVVLFNLRARMM